MKKEDLKKLANKLNEDDRKMFLEDLEMDEITGVDWLGNETVVGFMSDNWRKYLFEDRSDKSKLPMDLAIDNIRKYI